MSAGLGSRTYFSVRSAVDGEQELTKLEILEGKKWRCKICWKLPLIMNGWDRWWVEIEVLCISWTNLQCTIGLRSPSTFSEHLPWFWPYLLSKKIMKTFWYKIWVITISKSAKFLAWEVYWKRSKGLLLTFFLTFKNPIGPLALWCNEMLCYKHRNCHGPTQSKMAAIFKNMKRPTGNFGSNN